MKKILYTKTSFNIAMAWFGLESLAEDISVATRLYLVDRDSYSRYCAGVVAEDVCLGIKDLGLTDMSIVSVAYDYTTRRFKVTFDNRSKRFVSVEGDYKKELDVLASEFKTLELIIDEIKDVKLPPKSKTSKNKYTCPCGTNVWGKIGLNIFCGDCGGAFFLNTQWGMNLINALDF